MRYERIQKILKQGLEAGRISQEDIKTHNELWEMLSTAENKEEIMDQMREIITKADPDGSISSKLIDEELHA